MTARETTARQRLMRAVFLIPLIRAQTKDATQKINVKTVATAMSFIELIKLIFIK